MYTYTWDQLPHVLFHIMKMLNVSSYHQFFECLRFKMSKHEHSMLHQIPRKSFQMQYENK